jgi:hypothetical protein
MIEQAITLTLTRRAINALVAENITLDQLKTGHYSAANLMGVSNLGRKSVNDIREYLAKMGFLLKGEFDPELISTANKVKTKRTASNTNMYSSEQIREAINEVFDYKDFMAEEVLSILYAWDHDDVVQEKTNRKEHNDHMER